jgi:hypothetical protein
MNQAAIIKAAQQALANGSFDLVDFANQIANDTREQCCEVIIGSWYVSDDTVTQLVHKIRSLNKATVQA